MAAETRSLPHRPMAKKRFVFPAALLPSTPFPSVASETLLLSSVLPSLDDLSPGQIKFLTTFPTCDASPGDVRDWMHSWFLADRAFENDIGVVDFIQYIQIEGATLWVVSGKWLLEYFSLMAGGYMVDGWFPEGVLELFVEDVEKARAVGLERGARVVRAKIIQIIRESVLRVNDAEIKKPWLKAATCSILALYAVEERLRMKISGAWSYLRAAMGFVWVWWKLTIRLPKARMAVTSGGAVVEKAATQPTREERA